MSAVLPSRPSRAQGGTAAGAAATTIERLIALIDDLLVVIADENLILARGLPASLSPQTARKQILAAQFETWVKDVALQPVSIASCAPALQHELMDSIARLRGATDENIARLRAAMEATQRRVEAVMQAVRSEIASASPYGANGRVHTRRPGDALCNVSVRA